jgi:hypothetical protein
MTDSTKSTHVLKPQLGLEKAADMQPQADAATEKMYADVSSAIVRIDTAGGRGSGFFFDKDGHIATDAHVVEGADQVDVVLASGKTVPAKIDKLDDLNDVAILKIDGGTPEGIKVPSLDDSDDALKPDQHLWALGHPLGLNDTYISPGYFEFGTEPAGVVEAEGSKEVERVNTLISSMTPNERSDAHAALTRDVDECQLHVEGGNSGGPVLNASEAVVGLTDLADSSGTAIMTPVSYLDHLLHDSNPKFSFTYKFIPADQAKRNISKSGEYILTDRNRSDGEYRAPYTDQVFDGASMPQSSLPSESTGAGAIKSGPNGSGTILYNLAGNDTGNGSTANTELYSPDHSAVSSSTNVPSKAFHDLFQRN